MAISSERAREVAASQKRVPDKLGRMTFAPKLSKEERAKAIEDALQRLEAGETLKQIAPDYNVAPQALSAWLIVDAPESAGLARARYIGRKLTEHVSGIEEADDSLALARAREAFKAWSWIAERRLPQLFGQNREQADAQITIVINKLGEKSQIDVKTAKVKRLADPIDVTPEESEG